MARIPFYIDSLTTNRDEPAQGRRYIAIAGLYLFAVGAGAGPLIAYLGLGLVMLAFVTSLPILSQSVQRDVMVWMFGLFAVYIGICAFTAAHAIPSLSRTQWASLWPWYGLWFFVPVGWMIVHTRTSRTHLLLACVLGLILSILIHLPWTHLDVLILGKRNGLGMTNLATALYAGVAMLGWIGLAPRVCGSRNNAGYLPRVAFWLMVILILAQALVVSQSRAVWLSLALILTSYLGVRLFSVLRRIKTQPSYFRQNAVILATIVILVGIVASNWSTFTQRFGQEHRTIRDIVELRLDHVPQTSIGLRVYMARLGVIRFQQRPFLGWGPGLEITKDLSTAPFPFLAGWSHIHNTYLETLVRLGFLGFALAVLCVTIFCQRVIAAYRRAVIPRDLFLFFVNSGLLVALWSFIDFQALHADYRFFSAVALGVAYSYTCAPPNPGGAAPEAP